jgi:hypothetical protein
MYCVLMEKYNITGYLKGCFRLTAIGSLWYTVGPFFGRLRGFYAGKLKNLITY